MTVAKSFAISSSTATVVAWREHARVEKIHLSNKLDGKHHGAREQDSFAPAHSGRVQLCRSETADVAPIREEHRLVPTFVTQLLAQIMDGQDAAAMSAAAAYRTGLPKIALLCDRNA
jgi:hypothetical protein